MMSKKLSVLMLCMVVALPSMCIAKEVTLFGKTTEELFSIVGSPGSHHDSHIKKAIERVLRDAAYGSLLSGRSFLNVSHDDRLREVIHIFHTKLPRIVRDSELKKIMYGEQLLGYEVVKSDWIDTSKYNPNPAPGSDKPNEYTRGVYELLGKLKWAELIIGKNKPLRDPSMKPKYYQQVMGQALEKDLPILRPIAVQVYDFIAAFVLCGKHKTAYEQLQKEFADNEKAKQQSLELMATSVSKDEHPLMTVARTEYLALKPRDLARRYDSDRNKMKAQIREFEQWYIGFRHAKEQEIVDNAAVSYPTLTRLSALNGVHRANMRNLTFGSGSGGRSRLANRKASLTKAYNMRLSQLS